MNHRLSLFLLPLLLVWGACEMPQMQKLNNPFDPQSPNFSAKSIVPKDLAAFTESGQVLVTWGKIKDASAYNVYWSTSPTFTTSSATKVPVAESPYTVTGLQDGTTYYFAVTALSMGVESGLSEIISAQPTALPATRSTIFGFIGDISLVWNGYGWHGGTNQFSIPDESLAVGDKITVVYTLSSDQTADNLGVSLQGADNGPNVQLANGTTFVAPLNAGSKVSGQKVFSVTVPATKLLFWINADLPAANSTAGVLNLSFTKFLVFRNLTGPYIPVSGLDIPGGSQVLVSGGEPLTLRATVSPANSSTNKVTWSSSNTAVATVNESGVVTGVSAGTATIKALCLDGGFSDTATVTVAATAPAPTGLSTTAGASQVTLNWNPAAGATAYKVYYAPGATASKSSTPVDASAISGTSAVVTGLTNGTKYAFVVTAMNSVGEGAESSVATATPQAAATPTAPLWFTSGDLTLTSDGAWWHDYFYSVTGVDVAIGDNLTVVFAGSLDFPADNRLYVRLQDSTGALENETTLKSAVANDQVISSVVRITITKNMSVQKVDLGLAKNGPGSVKATITKFEIFKNLDGLYVPSTGVTMATKTATWTVAGGVQTLNASVTPSNATNQSLNWSSSNTTVATVDSTGKVTPKAAGTATIKALSMDGGLSDTCVVTVQ